MRSIEEIARDIAQRAPKKQGTYVFAAQIPWALINELREAIARADGR